MQSGLLAAAHTRSVAFLSALLVLQAACATQEVPTTRAETPDVGTRPPSPSDGPRVLRDATPDEPPPASDAAPAPAPPDAAADTRPSPPDALMKEDATAAPLPAAATWEVDLTTGDPGARIVEVKGGTWGGGWRVTSAGGDRLVYDMGRSIKSGYLEVSLTVNKHPHATPGKINWAGLYESASLNQDLNGDIFYARVGDNKYGFSRVKAAGHKFDMTEWEPSVGSASDWVVDDKTVHTVKFEWRQGQAFFHDSKGRKYMCATNACGGSTPMDGLRYVFLGADKWPRFNTDHPDNLSAVGMRFVRAKLVETP